VAVVVGAIPLVEDMLLVAHTGEEVVLTVVVAVEDIPHTKVSGCVHCLLLHACMITLVFGSGGGCRTAVEAGQETGRPSHLSRLVFSPVRGFICRRSGRGKGACILFLGQTRQINHGGVCYDMNSPEK
jgi:hypothetical protein